jgi:hypothetical protein
LGDHRRVPRPQVVRFERRLGAGPYAEMLIREVMKAWAPNHNADSWLGIKKPEGGMILPIHENKFVMRTKANDEIYTIDGICIFCML